jgi:hypothetical protein
LLDKEGEVDSVKSLRDVLAAMTDLEAGFLALKPSDTILQNKSEAVVVEPSDRKPC